MSPSLVLSKVDSLFAERGGSEYHGEAVTQLEHALQCAWLAEKDGHPTSLIAAALLHDVGHLLHDHDEDYLDKNINDRHEDMAAKFLKHAYGPAVTEPIRLHVPAKRYLAATRPAYLGLLSPASIKSLELQGGPMNPDEVAEFEQGPHYADAIILREYDDRAKDVTVVTPPYAHFRPFLAASLREAL